MAFRSAANRDTASTGSVAFGCSASRTRGPSASAFPSRTRSCARRRRARRQTAATARTGCRPPAQARGRSRDAFRKLFDLQRKRQREVLLDRERVQQHDALAQDAEPIHLDEPRIRVGDVARRDAEHIRRRPSPGSVAPVMRLTRISAATDRIPGAPPTQPSRSSRCSTRRRPKAPVVLDHVAKRDDDVGRGHVQAEGDGARPGVVPIRRPAA